MPLAACKPTSKQPAAGTGRLATALISSSATSARSNASEITFGSAVRWARDASSGTTPTPRMDLDLCDDSSERRLDRSRQPRLFHRKMTDRQYQTHMADRLVTE